MHGTDGSRLVVGVDIGNSTTEACVASIDAHGRVDHLGTALTRTTGVKGTPDNTAGAVTAVRRALEEARRAVAGLCNERWFRPDTPDLSVRRDGHCE
ncbi:hypothetical protein FVA95_23280 [Pseudonocardia sp. EV170527-09]|uniref:hypothetical protein n=1 Tax=Pseudonocardia sp. EV170527-09 TaxID=2603411 RepID=UPI0011F17CC2|nr:hypothetical protein [Pseudonocardia sp. EV170527-09]KAA1019136.1 hypothetical protein FVA95_23280 [Pseudonocardia sp. EV170527-09]